jgi:protein gp37
MTSKIEWLKSADGKPGYTINPVKGLCPVACSYCYARRMYKRFKWNPEIRYDDWVWQEGKHIPPGSRVFVGSTIDLFHEKTIQYLPTILEYVECIKSSTFIFLTKCPENLPKVFPDNCWVGLSVDGTENAPLRRIYNGLNKCEATVKFISFEPLLAQTKLDHRDLEDCGINWVIIGQQTPVKMSTMPQVGWVEEIVSSADKANIPVFLKDNLISCVDQYPFAFSGKFPNLKFRQEYPLVSFKDV